VRRKAEIVDLRFDLWGSGPKYLTIGGQQSLWVSCTTNADIAGLFRDGTSEKYPVDGVPRQIALGGENIWFTMPLIDTVGRVDHEGANHNYKLPDGSAPDGIAATEAEAWVTLSGTGGLARIPIDEEVQLVSPKVTGDDELVDPPPAEPRFLAMDDRGSLWFTRQGRGDIVRMDTDHTTESWAEPGCAAPSAIAADQDAVWIADSNEPGIWRIGRAEKLLQRVEPWPTGFATAIASDQRGGCWFTEADEDLVGHFDGDSTIIEYDISEYGEKPRGLAVDRDGIAWVALRSGGIVGVRPERVGGPRYA
jgi:virginiamycin B lyase